MNNLRSDSCSAQEWAISKANFSHHTMAEQGKCCAARRFPIWGGMIETIVLECKERRETGVGRDHRNIWEGYCGKKKQQAGKVINGKRDLPVCVFVGGEGRRAQEETWEIRGV